MNSSLSHGSTPAKKTVVATKLLLLSFSFLSTVISSAELCFSSSLFFYSEPQTTRDQDTPPMSHDLSTVTRNKKRTNLSIPSPSYESSQLNWHYCHGLAWIEALCVCVVVFGAFVCVRVVVHFQSIKTRTRLILTMWPLTFSSTECFVCVRGEALALLVLISSIQTLHTG